MKRTPLEDWIMRKIGSSVRNRKPLEDYQVSRIREVIRYAKNSSRFYSDFLADVIPDDIHTLRDLRRVPFTVPDHLRARPFDFLCVPQSDVKRVVTLRSSGTAGMEKRVFFSEDDLGRTVDFFAHGMSCLAGRQDRVMVLLPGSAYGSIGDLLNKALASMGIACFVHGVVTDEDKAAESIIENDITCLVGIPQQILYLSRTKSEAFAKIRSVLLSADYVPEVLIRELKDRFGCSVFTHYGMTEMGYGGGVECDALNGCHLREADLYFEIVDPENGLPVEDGRTGEVVFTTLSGKAMNLIRYRTGDLASFSPIPCACGTFLKTMNRVRGRLENTLLLGENRPVALSELDEIIFSLPDVLNYTASLEQGGRLCFELLTRTGGYELSANEAKRRVWNYLCEKFGRDLIPEIEIRPQTGKFQIRNSMVKRTFRDLRQPRA